MENGKKIMLVDDSSTVRQLLKMMLVKHLPCEVSMAQDGVEAIEKLGSESFDIVITDINMPRMDGLTLVRTLRQQMGLDIPIIIVTTKGAENDRDAGMKLGANSYITKPVNGTSLATAVQSLIS